MSSCFQLILMFISMRYLAVKTASWTLRSGLFHVDGLSAIGAFNDTIFLIGGYFNPRQITKYHIKSQQFIDLGTDAVDGDFSGNGQYWTQQQHIIYTTNNDQFNIYNMETNEYIGNWKGITISETTCCSSLASTESYLFITGGAGIDTLQILSLSSFEWITNAPPMNTARGKHACITNNDLLWVFGGTGANSKEIDLNERIRITDITQNTWNNVDPLTLKLTNLRAVALADNIYIVGGYGGISSNNADQQAIIHVMDANTGSITVFPDDLPLRNEGGSSIIVDGVLFVMGAFHNSAGVITTNYAYYPLSTMAPTASTNPSSDPYAEPSPAPIVPPFTTPSPSDNPSRASSPSWQQTSDPSTHVSTDNPSLNLTDDSSPEPTGKPFTKPPSVPIEQSDAEPTDATEERAESQSKYDEKIVIIVCLSIIILLYLLYKFKKKITTLLRTSANIEAEIVDEIEPGRAENNAPVTEEGHRDNDDVDERDDSEGLCVKDAANTTAGVTQTSRGENCDV